MEVFSKQRRKRVTTNRLTNLIGNVTLSKVMTLGLLFLAVDAMNGARFNRVCVRLGAVSA